MTTEIREIFRQSRNNYGTQKIKVKLCEKGYTVSRRRIGWIMKQEGFVSTSIQAAHRQM
ncbi:MAG: phosphoribosylformylglycinamidine synthase [Clostridiales bacterium]|nr:MAG: phosphoribosylformylglycinamidine synthase [Clostridiales bacterium]